MQFGISLLQEAGDHVGALRAAGCEFTAGRGGLLGSGHRGGSGSGSAGFRRGGASLRFGGTAETDVSTWYGGGFREIRLDLAGLVNEAGILLIALGGKTDVIELNFIRARLRYEFGQRNVIILHLGLRWIGPDQFAVFAPGLFVPLRLDGKFGMLNHQALIAEDGDAGDGVHVL